jgi:hypothetical protein
VDPLSCPQCGHEMKIISLIHELDVIECTLRHLGLWKQPPDSNEVKESNFLSPSFPITSYHPLAMPLFSD